MDLGETHMQLVHSMEVIEMGHSETQLDGKS